METLGKSLIIGTLIVLILVICWFLLKPTISQVLKNQRRKLSSENNPNGTDEPQSPPHVSESLDSAHTNRPKVSPNGSFACRENEYEGAAQRYRAHNIRLYHFTDSSNRHSIESRGWIFPRCLVEQQSIAVKYVSSPLSRDIDNRKGLDEYVHVGFHPDHKMSYTAQSRTLNGLCLLEINSGVLNRPGARVMKGLANKSGVDWEMPQDFTDEDLARISTRDDETRYWQAIIPGAISSKDFHFVDL